MSAHLVPFFRVNLLDFLLKHLSVLPLLLLKDGDLLEHELHLVLRHFVVEESVVKVNLEVQVFELVVEVRML